MKTEQKISKWVVYKEKVSLFREYAREYPDKELFPLFTEWADNIELFDIDKHEVCDLLINKTFMKYERIAW